MAPVYGCYFLSLPLQTAFAPAVRSAGRASVAVAAGAKSKAIPFLVRSSASGWAASELDAL